MIHYIYNSHFFKQFDRLFTSKYLYQKNPTAAYRPPPFPRNNDMFKKV